MNLSDKLELHEYLVETCHCGIGVGDPVTVDGSWRGRGVVVRRNGRRLTIQFRSGLRIDRDQSFVHPIGATPGHIKDVNQ